MSSSLTLVLLVIFLLITLGLAASLFLIRRSDRKKDHGNYFQSQVGPIHFKVHGNKGPWVLLIHGLGGSSYCWRHIVPELEKKYRVLTMDLWGFGHSTKAMPQPMSLDLHVEILKELVESLYIDKFSVVGHSMGGHLALWWSMQDKRIQKVIAIAPATHPSLVSGLLTMFAWIANWTPLVVNRASIARIIKKVLRDPSFITEDMLDSYYQPYKDPDSHLSFAAALQVIKENKVYESLGQLKENSVMIWGDSDRVITKKARQDIQSITSHIQHITHPEAGHLPMEDDFHWLNDQLLRLLLTLST